MVPEVNRAQVLAQEINTIKEYTKRQVLAASIEIGNRLCEAKALVNHGDWEEWLAQNVSYSQSTANNLMRISKEYGTDQMLIGGKVTSEIFDKLTYTQAVVLLGLPMEERVEIVEQNDVENMSTRELEQAVAARKKAEKEAQALTEDVQKWRSAAEKYKKSAEESDALRKSIEGKEHELQQLRIDGAKNLDKQKAKYQALEKKLAEMEQNAGQAAERMKQEVEKAKETIRTEYAQELQNAHRQAEDLQKKIEKASGSVVQKFAIYLEQFKDVYEKLCNTADEVGDEDEKEAQKMYAGIEKVLHMMLSGIEE